MQMKASSMFFTKNQYEHLFHVTKNKSENIATALLTNHIFLIFSYLPIFYKYKYAFRILSVMSILN